MNSNITHLNRIDEFVYDIELASKNKKESTTFNIGTIGAEIITNTLEFIYIPGGALIRLLDFRKYKDPAKLIQELVKSGIFYGSKLGVAAALTTLWYSQLGFLAKVGLLFGIGGPPGWVLYGAILAGVLLSYFTSKIFKKRNERVEAEKRKYFQNYQKYTLKYTWQYFRENKDTQLQIINLITKIPHKKEVKSISEEKRVIKKYLKYLQNGKKPWKGFLVQNKKRLKTIDIESLLTTIVILLFSTNNDESIIRNFLIKLVEELKDYKDEFFEDAGKKIENIIKKGTEEAKAYSNFIEAVVSAAVYMAKADKVVDDFEKRYIQQLFIQIPNEEKRRELRKTFQEADQEWRPNFDEEKLSQEEKENILIQAWGCARIDGTIKIEEEMRYLGLTKLLKVSEEKSKKIQERINKAFEKANKKEE